MGVLVDFALSFFNSYWAFVLIVPIFWYSFLVFVGTHLTVEAKDSLVLWLWGEYESTWSRQFCKVFDSVFSHKHLSWKCFYRSSQASIVAVLILYWMFGPVLGFLETEDRAGGTLSIGQLLFYGILFNLIPDYISLFETRWLLQCFGKVRSVIGQFIVLLLDAAFTALIIWFAINFYASVNSKPWVSFPQIAGGFSIYSVFFYSTFFTSLWAWLYCVTVWFMRLFCRTSLKKYLVSEDSPLKSVALISSVLLLIVCLISAPILKKYSSNSNDWWCDNFTSTCQDVYRLAEDNQKAFEYLLKTCISGNEKFCIEKAYKYFEDDGQKTIELLSKGCENGGMRNCEQLGHTYAHDSKLKDYSLALKFYNKSCEYGYVNSCLLISYMYSSGTGVDKNDKKASLFKLKGCDYGDGFSCISLAMDYKNKGALQEDNAELYTEAYMLFRRACDINRNNGFRAIEATLPAGCTYLGTMHKEGSGVATDYKYAIVLYKESCSNGDIYGCGNLGVMYKDGVGVKKNIKEALQLFDRFCERGEEEMTYNDYGLIQECTYLGFKYQKGVDIVQNYNRAAYLYEKTCSSSSNYFDMYDEDGCARLGFLYEKGFGVTQNIQQAVELYNKACDQFSDIGCAYLARAYWLGNGVIQNKQKAISLYEKACNAGSNTGCFMVTGKKRIMKTNGK